MTPNRDAFVIWIEGPADPAAPSESLRGRVEHLQSSARGSFGSAAELLVFLDDHRGQGDGSTGSS